MLEISLFPRCSRGSGVPACLTPGGSCHLVPLGNIQEVISSQFPLQSRIPHAARINTPSSSQALLFRSRNLISSCRLDHMLQIPCKQDRKQNSNSGNMCELHLKKAVKKTCWDSLSCCSWELRHPQHTAAKSSRRTGQLSPVQSSAYGVMS